MAGLPVKLGVADAGADVETLPLTLETAENEGGALADDIELALAIADPEEPAVSDAAGLCETMGDSVCSALAERDDTPVGLCVGLALSVTAPLTDDDAVEYADPVVEAEKDVRVDAVTTPVAVPRVEEVANAVAVDAEDTLLAPDMLATAVDVASDVRLTERLVEPDAVFNAVDEREITLDTDGTSEAVKPDEELTLPIVVREIRAVRDAEEAAVVDRLAAGVELSGADGEGLLDASPLSVGDGLAAGDFDDRTVSLRTGEKVPLALPRGEALLTALPLEKALAVFDAETERDTEGLVDELLCWLSVEETDAEAVNVLKTDAVGDEEAAADVLAAALIVAAVDGETIPVALDSTVAVTLGQPVENADGDGESGAVPDKIAEGDDNEDGDVSDDAVDAADADGDRVPMALELSTALALFTPLVDEDAEEHALSEVAPLGEDVDDGEVDERAVDDDVTSDVVDAVAESRTVFVASGVPL